MLQTVLSYLHNWFPDEANAIQGTFTVSAGSITPTGTLKNTQYFLVDGSTFNDGLHQFGVDDLIDESFEGVVVPLKIPAELFAIVCEMETWETNNANGVFQSENLSGSGYSYSRMTGSNGKLLTATDVFAHKLRRWKKL